MVVKSLLSKNLLTFKANFTFFDQGETYIQCSIFNQGIVLLKWVNLFLFPQKLNRLNF